MKVVGRGNANIVIDYGDHSDLYRCCIRDGSSLFSNNEYTLENLRFIEFEIKPLLNQFLCPMEMLTIPLPDLNDELAILYALYVRNLDDDKIRVLKIPNLKPNLESLKILQNDHFTKVYINSESTKVIYELKPKWLHNPGKYCRNCTHNRYKGRDIDYCYTRLLNDSLHMHNILWKCKDQLPSEFIENIIAYFQNKGNVLRYLHDIQEKLFLDNSNLSLLMTLRDITCFLTWNAKDPTRFDVKIVDVDLKTEDKVEHWRRTHRTLEKFENKQIHDKI